MSIPRMLRFAGRRSSSEDDAWLAGALDRVRAGESADVALELTGRAAVKAANGELLRAAELLDPDCQLSAWRLAGLLSDALATFRMKYWVATKASDRPPDSLGALDRVLWCALMSSESLPCSQGNIHTLLTEAHRTPRSQKRVQDFLTQKFFCVRPRQHGVTSSRSKKGESR